MTRRHLFLAAAAGIGLSLTGGTATRTLAAPAGVAGAPQIKVLGLNFAASEKGVRVSGLVRGQPFPVERTGGRLHLTAFRKDGSSLVGVDIPWQPAPRHRLVSMPFHGTLPGVAASDVARIDVKYRSYRRQ